MIIIQLPVRVFNLCKYLRTLSLSKTFLTTIKQQIRLEVEMEMYRICLTGHTGLLAQVHTHKYTDIADKSISRNQVYTIPGLKMYLFMHR